MIFSSPVESMSEECRIILNRNEISDTDIKSIEEVELTGLGLIKLYSLEQISELSICLERSITIQGDFIEITIF